MRQQSIDWRDRAHFFGLAATMMRRVLIDHARARNRLKRRSDETPTAFLATTGDAPQAELIDLDRALERFAQSYPRQTKMVEMRYFAGLEIEEIAACLDLSPATVKRDWQFARAWLVAELSATPAGARARRSRTPARALRRGAGDRDDSGPSRLLAEVAAARPGARPRALPPARRRRDSEPAARQAIPAARRRGPTSRTEAPHCPSAIGPYRILRELGQRRHGPRLPRRGGDRGLPPHGRAQGDRPPGPGRGAALSRRGAHPLVARASRDRPLHRGRASARRHLVPRARVRRGRGPAHPRAPPRASRRAAGRALPRRARCGRLRPPARRRPSRPEAWPSARRPATAGRACSTSASRSCSTPRRTASLGGHPHRVARPHPRLRQPRAVSRRAGDSGVGHLLPRRRALRAAGRPPAVRRRRRFARRLERAVLETDPEPPSQAAKRTGSAVPGGAIRRRRATGRDRGVGRDLDAICLKALRKEPGERYATAAELCRRLCGVTSRDGRSSLAAAAGATARALRRSPARPVATYCAVTLALAAIAFAWRVQGRSTRSDRRGMAVPPVARPRSAASLEPWGTESVAELEHRFAAAPRAWKPAPRSPRPAAATSASRRQRWSWRGRASSRARPRIRCSTRSKE